MKISIMSDPNHPQTLTPIHRLQGRNRIFIVKPSNGRQGKGIVLTRNPLDLPLEDCVVQQYISKPMLIDGYGAHVRLSACVCVFNACVLGSPGRAETAGGPWEGWGREGRQATVQARQGCWMHLD